MTEVQRLAKIMILKDMLKEYELLAKYNGGTDYDRWKALDLAINELEQEPCEDAISRKAVLEIIRFEDKWLLDAKGHNVDTKMAFWAIKSKISELASVNPNRKAE